MQNKWHLNLLCIFFLSKSSNLVEILTTFLSITFSYFAAFTKSFSSELYFDIGNRKTIRNNIICSECLRRKKRKWEVEQPFMSATKHHGINTCAQTWCLMYVFKYICLSPNIFTNLCYCLKRIQQYEITIYIYFTFIEILLHSTQKCGLIYICNLCDKIYINIFLKYQKQNNGLIGFYKKVKDIHFP